MREEFEKWAKDDFMLAYSGARYSSVFTQRAWEAWQAATALQAERVRELEEALQLSDAALRGKNINLKALSRRVNLALSATAREQSHERD
jgi:hypothetical protein